MAEKETIPGQGELIGVVTHYFGKAGVAIVSFAGKISLGDVVRIVGGETDYEQKIESMEMDKKKIEKASKGDVVGLKVDQKTKEGCKLYKL